MFFEAKDYAVFKFEILIQLKEYISVLISLKYRTLNHQKIE